jgi:hypothetical protein
MALTPINSARAFGTMVGDVITLGATDLLCFPFKEAIEIELGAGNADGALLYVRIENNLSSAYPNFSICEATFNTSPDRITRTATKMSRSGATYGAVSVVHETNVVVGGVSFAGVFISSSLGTGNFRAGDGAGASIAVGGDGNTAVGDSALAANTTGDYNTASGYLALEDATTASANSAFGAYSLQNVTTGNGNTASGFQALSANTTGIQNTAVGYNVLLSNTTGNRNTATGAYALSLNTGTANTAFGYGGLYANTTGTANAAVGYSALYANTTGGYNTAVGYNSLLSNTTGLYNTAIGMGAMDASVSGHYNTSVGQDSLGGLSTGGLNTVIGRAAGWTLTTGSQNTLLGYNAQASTGSTDSAVVIGLSVTGAGGYSTIGYGASDIRAAHGVATWAAVSDERYKQNITDSSAGLDFVNLLRPRTWDYKTLGELPETFDAYVEGSTEVFKNTHTNHGFIAQEVKAAIDADSGIKDGFKMWDERTDGSQEVAEASLIPVLVKSIQELSAQVSELTDRLATLEEK